MSGPNDPIPALWALLVELAEAGHDAVVMAQRRPNARAAKAARAWAEDVSAIARAAEIFAHRTGGRR